MMEDDEIRHKRELIVTHRKRIQVLEIQEASQGLKADPQLKNEIDVIRQKIEALQNEINQMTFLNPFGLSSSSIINLNLSPTITPHSTDSTERESTDAANNKPTLAERVGRFAGWAIFIYLCFLIYGWAVDSLLTGFIYATGALGFAIIVIFLWENPKFWEQ